MMTTDAPPADGQRFALGAVRAALLADADDEAELILSDAQFAADLDRAAAEADVDTQLERARKRSQTSADAHRQQLLAQAHHQAQTIIMEAREATRVELIADLRSQVMRLREDDRYPQLLDNLEAAARRQLGADAVIERDPEMGGGVIGRAGGRSVDYTLPVLADRAMGAFGQEMAALWS